MLRSYDLDTKLMRSDMLLYSFFFLNDPAPTEIYPLPQPDALPIKKELQDWNRRGAGGLVKSVDVPAKAVTITVSSLGTSKDMVVKTGANTRIRRYSEDSRSEEHTSELQSQSNLVCRLLLEKKKRQT